eukprot:403333467
MAIVPIYVSAMLLIQLSKFSDIFKRISTRVNNVLFFGFLLRIGVESYMDMSVDCLLNMRRLIWDTQSDKFGSIFTLLTLILLVILFLIWQLIYIIKKRKQLNSEIFNKKYSQLYEGIKTQGHVFPLFVTTFMLLRRLIFAYSVVFLGEYKVLQLFLMIFSNVLYIAYLFLAKPYDQKSLFYQELFNEICTLTCSYHLLLFTDDNILQSPQIHYDFGWILIAFTLLNMIINTIIMVAQTIKQIKLKINSLIVKFRNRKKKHVNTTIVDQYSSDISQIVNLKSSPHLYSITQTIPRQSKKKRIYRKIIKSKNFHQSIDFSQIQQFPIKNRDNSVQNDTNQQSLMSDDCSFTDLLDEYLDPTTILKYGQKIQGQEKLKNNKIDKKKKTRRKKQGGVSTGDKIQIDINTQQSKIDEQVVNDKSGQMKLNSNNIIMQDHTDFYRILSIPYQNKESTNKKYDEGNDMKDRKQIQMIMQQNYEDQLVLKRN